MKTGKDRLFNGYIIQALITSPNAYVQVSDGLVTMFVFAFDCSYVMAGFLITMFGDGVALRVVFANIPIRLHSYFRTAITEVPYLVAMGGAERTDLEGDFVAGLDIECWIISCVDGGRQSVAMFLVNYQDNGKVVINVAGCISDF